MYSILHDSDLSTDRPRKPIKCPERLAKIFRIGIGFVKCCASNILPRPFDFQSVEYAQLVLPSMFSRDWNCRLFDMSLSSVASFEMPCRSPGGWNIVTCKVSNPSSDLDTFERGCRGIINHSWMKGASHFLGICSQCPEDPWLQLARSENKYTLEVWLFYLPVVDRTWTIPMAGARNQRMSTS